jgi:hypothetical protein
MCLCFCHCIHICSGFKAALVLTACPSMDDFDDLLDLVHLAGVGASGRPVAAARRQRVLPPIVQMVIPQPLPQPGGELAQALGEVGDLAELVAIGEVRPVRRHEHRSWQALEHARAAKTVKRKDSQLVVSEQKRCRAEALLQMVSEECPLIANLCHLPTKRAPVNEARAAFMEQLAFMPTIRGDDRGRTAQGRAVSLVASVGADVQQACVERLWSANEGASPEEGVSPEEQRLFRIHVLSWQWDETTQKLRAVLVGKAFLGERCSQASVSKQIMMQHGFVTKYLVTDRNIHTTTEPILCRGLVLESQTARTMLEGIRRCSPVKFDEAASVAKMAALCDVCIWSFCCDRASANFAVLKSIWAWLAKPDMPRNVLPFVEPCAAHGVALVKGRPQAGKTLVAASHTLSACFRQSRFAQAFRDCLVALVRTNLVVRREQRPVSVYERSDRIIEMLYGGLDDNYLFKTTSDGQQVPTSFYDDLLALSGVIDMGAPPEEQWMHWCFVAEGSQMHSEGHPAGGPCCASHEDSVELVAVPLLNFLLHRQWSQAAISRWTYVGTTLRKIAIGFLCNRVLPQSLSDLQSLWDVKLGNEALLERLVAADSEDFASKSKLRLLRCCQAFVPAAASWQLAVQLTVLSASDGLLYRILGDGKTARANLATLMDEAASPIAGLLHQLLLLLQEWTPGCRRWELLEALGGSFEDDDVQRWARHVVLQTAAATFDHFEQRMSHPPYTLFKLGDVIVPLPARKKIAEDFLATDDHCLSGFCCRLKELLPTVWDLLEKGPSIMGALAAGSVVAIDATERSHGQMRLDIRSTGTSSNFTAAANRVFCHELRAEHMRRSGTDPAKSHSSLVDGGRCEGEAAVVPANARKLRGGNSNFEWRNARLAAFKARVAPDRPLTDDELQAFREKCLVDWGTNVSDVEKNAWGLVARGARLDRQSQAIVPAAVPQQKDFRRVWGATLATATCPLPPAAIATKYRETPVKVRRAIAAQDPTLLVENSCHNLTCEPGVDRPTTLCGCGAEKKTCAGIAWGRICGQRLKAFAHC